LLASCNKLGTSPYTKKAKLCVAILAGGDV
jgi:hypothetical protein